MAGKPLYQSPCPETRIIVKDLFSGCGYVITGFKLILKPGIRLFALIPVLVNTLLFAGLIFYGANQLSSLIHYLSSLWAWAEWFSWLLWPLFIIIILIVVFFCFSIVANLIAAPFNGFLAEAVENMLTGKNTNNPINLAKLPAELLAAFISESRKFVYFIVRAIPLFLLLAIPFIGPAIWFLFGAWMLALEYLEFPLSNNGLLFSETREVLTARRQLTFGFGMGVMFISIIPIVNFIAMPVAVIGATKLWTDHLKDQQCN